MDKACFVGPRNPANTPASQENLESLMEAALDTDVIACDVQCASNARNGNLSGETVSFAPILGGYREVFSANLERIPADFWGDQRFSHSRICLDVSVS